MKATLILNKNAISDRKKRFEAAQEYVDKKSLEYMTLYVPVGLPRYKNSGKLRDSGKIAGRGKIVYTAPKARETTIIKLSIIDTAEIRMRQLCGLKQ